MKIIITESQKQEVILPNEKRALDFDRKYGTTLSQRYQFPFGLTGDVIWTIFSKCKLHKHIKIGDEFLGVNRFSKTPDEYCAIWNKIVNSLSTKHFPYNGVDKLPFDYKQDILCGMASEFNANDIVHYSIKRIYGYMNDDVEDEVNKTFPRYIVNDIHWVMSPATLEKMKQQLSNRRLNTIDYV